ncbi:MAG TPA: plastocyanin/azurin family copper-binding protein [Sphingobacteriaceae bacterium]
MLTRNLLLLVLIPLFTGSDVGVNPKVHTVEIKGMKFLPAEVRVKKGDIVLWINKDMVVHNVTEEKSRAWTSQAIPAGKSWKMVVKQSDAYFCTLHPVMKGKIRILN